MDTLVNIINNCFQIAKNVFNLSSNCIIRMTMAMSKVVGMLNIKKFIYCYKIIHFTKKL